MDKPPESEPVDEAPRIPEGHEFLGPFAEHELVYLAAAEENAEAEKQRVFFLAVARLAEIRMRDPRTVGIARKQGRWYGLTAPKAPADSSAEKPIP